MNKIIIYMINIFLAIFVVNILWDSINNKLIIVKY
jgi:hypothetical protein